MAENPYLRLNEPDPAARHALYEQLYDRAASQVGPDMGIVPQRSSRRIRRLSLYATIIGPMPGSVLEIGCGTGDLTCALAANATRVVAIDLSSHSLEVAKLRLAREPQLADRVEFVRMNAVKLQLRDASFDLAVSTSMIEHLYPDDVDMHLREVWRVLRPGGKYLVWCPNRLGHHKDRPFHLCMMSHRDLRQRMLVAGFTGFRSPLFAGRPMVGTAFKIAMETALYALRIRILWSHLGVRNVLIVASKDA